MTGTPVAPAGGIRRASAQPGGAGLAVWMFPVGIVGSLQASARKEGWVARCTAPGLNGTAQRVDRMGASWRDQTSHIPLRMRLCSSSINSCRWNCQFFPLYFTRNCGCRMPEIQAARADPPKQVGRYLCTGRDGLLRSAPMRKTLRVCCRQ
jgi:hypothetical protein